MGKAKLLLLIALGSLFACQNGKSPKERELDIRERELKQKEKELEFKKQQTPSVASTVTTTQVTTPINKTMYMYVVLKVNIPEIATRMTPGELTLYDRLNDLPPMPGKEKYWMDSYYNIKSDVVSINDYNDDKKYMEIDAVKNKVRQQWALSPLSDFDAGNVQREILSAEGRVFSTYSEASISKSKRQ